MYVDDNTKQFVMINNLLVVLKCHGTGIHILHGRVNLMLIENRLFAYKPCRGQSRRFAPNRFGIGTFRLGYSLTFYHLSNQGSIN